MQKHKNTSKRCGLLLAITLVCLASLAVPSANAMIRDPRIVSRLQMERNDLLNQQQHMLQEYEDLRRQVDELKRRDSDPRVVDQLCRDMDSKSRDLKQVEFDLHDVEGKLM